MEAESTMSSLGLTKNQSRGWRRKHKDHTKFLRDLFEAQVSCGRYFVHEYRSQVHSRLRCVTRIMVTPQTRTYVSNVCMVGLVAGDEGGSGFVNASVRMVSNARQVGMRMPTRCAGTHRHARVGANNASETMEHLEKHLLEDEQELTRWEQKEAMDAKMIQGMVDYKHDKIKRTTHVQDVMRKLLHHEELPSLSFVARVGFV